MGTQKTSWKEAKLHWLPRVTIAESHRSKDLQIGMMNMREAWLIQLQLENRIVRCQVGKVTLERWVLPLSWGLSTSATLRGRSTCLHRLTAIHDIPLVNSHVHAQATRASYSKFPLRLSYIPSCEAGFWPLGAPCRGINALPKPCRCNCAEWDWNSSLHILCDSHTFPGSRATC